MDFPAYLFTGPEFGERNDVVEELKKKTQKKFGDVDFYSFYLSETKLSDIISLLQNGSLFASARFAVVKNAELIKKKDELEMLSQWFSSAASDDASVIVFISEETGVDKKFENLFPKSNRRIFWEMFEDRKESWLRNYFQKLNFTIDQDAVDAVLDLIENNTEALRTECSRFQLCFEQGHRITQDDVESVLAHNREESAFTLFDALSNSRQDKKQRFETALLILQKILLSKGASGVQVIAGLTYCFRRLKQWHEIHLSGRPSEFDLKIKGFSSKKAQNQYAGAQRIWSGLRTLDILALLSKTDMEIRSAGTAVEETLLSTMLYSVVYKDGLPLSQYQS